MRHSGKHSPGQLGFERSGQSEAQLPVLVLSNIIVDDLWLSDGRHFPNTLGGAAVYAAVGAALWWKKVGIVAGVGSDLDIVTKGQLDKFGLLPDGYLVRSEHSIQSRLVYGADGHRMETPSRGREHFESLQFIPKDIPNSMLPAAGTYIFRDLEPAFWEGVKVRRRLLGTVMWELQDDAALPSNWDTIRHCLALVDLFSLNLAEARSLFGVDDADLVLDHLLGTGVSAVVLRMGAAGALVAVPDRRFRIVPPPSEVVDVTGGGNAFTGGFLAGWIASGGDPEPSARCAAGSAAHALGQYGPANPQNRETAKRWADAAQIIPERLGPQVPTRTNQFDDYQTQIASLAELARTQTQSIADRGRLTLSTPDIYGLRQIILTGSGDSYFAAVAAAPAIRAWTGLPVQTMVAMEASRYVDAGVPPLAGRNRGLLVVAISSSGEAARLVEATLRLRHLGALTLALTASPHSRLAQAAERVMDMAIPSSTPAPGTRSYVASLIAIYLLGLRLAEVLMCMTMDTANALRNEIAGLGDAIGNASKDSETKLANLADAWQGYTTVDCLGSGPSFGTACFAAAKLVEAAGVHAAAQDAEEFHHLNYFVERVDSVPAVLFAPGNALSRTRTQELSEALQQLGRPHAIVTDDPTLASTEHIVLVPRVREWFAPIVQAVPASLLAAHWAARIGTTHFRGHQGPWRGAVGAGLVRNSKIELSN